MTNVIKTTSSACITAHLDLAIFAR